jgi:hypothetical protein
MRLTIRACLPFVQSVPSGEVLPGDMDLLREISTKIENPLYLLLDTTDGAGVRDLPVQVFESEVRMLMSIKCLWMQMREAI